MTPPIPVGVSGGRASLVPDQTYQPTLVSLVDGAVRRCLCSVFIVDVSPLRDRSLRVDALLQALGAARWRGVDVRLVIGGSRGNLDIAETADVARARARELGVPCRWATSARRRGTHAKLAVVDDFVLTGSHNWSGGAFRDQVQDSVLVASTDLAAYLTSLFEQQWTEAGSEAP
jgi:phosphatidylserine/phosphatidylglycerophosphate/cardiolipin synthase-like enzyme